MWKYFSSLISFLILAVLFTNDINAKPHVLTDESMPTATPTPTATVTGNHTSTSTITLIPTTSINKTIPSAKPTVSQVISATPTVYQTQVKSIAVHISPTPAPKVLAARTMNEEVFLVTTLLVSGICCLGGACWLYNKRGANKE